MISKHYEDTSVLENISLKITKGDIYGIVGSSGAGKSTLLRCINGLTNYDKGEIVLFNTAIHSLTRSELKKFRRNIGMIFQNFSLLDRRNVYGNIAFPLECWNYSDEEIKDRVQRLLKIVDLKDKIHSFPRELSGGQKQRVAIARALALKPKILLCDEATSALDPNIASSILQLLRTINEEFNLTMVVVTHQMSVIKQICNKMAIIKNGMIIESGNVPDIFMNNSIHLQDLLGSSYHKNLPKVGLNVKIIIKDDDPDKKLFYELGKCLDSPYSIVWGGLDKFRDTIMGLFIINIPNENFQNLIEHLNKNNIQWEVL